MGENHPYSTRWNKSSPKYLTTENYEKILKWNRSLGLLCQYAH